MPAPTEPTEMQLLTQRIYALEQTQLSAMTGWNTFLNRAEDQLKILFNGSIPKPILRRLLTAMFKGVESDGRDDLKVTVPRGYE
jgi:hypothetical protein